MPVSTLTFRGFFMAEIRDKNEKKGTLEEEGRKGGREDVATLGRAEGKEGDGESGEFVANKLDFPSILFRCRRCSDVVQSRAALFPLLCCFFTGIREATN